MTFRAPHSRIRELGRRVPKTQPSGMAVSDSTARATEGGKLVSENICFLNGDFSQNEVEIAS
jgi:hypothetical protein